MGEGDWIVVGLDDLLTREFGGLTARRGGWRRRAME